MLIIQVQKKASEHGGIYRTEHDSDIIWFKQINIFWILWEIEVKVGWSMEE